MPRCEVCDGEDFELQDGLYFCTMCQTQSQNLLEEEYSDGEFSAAAVSSSSSSIRYRVYAKKRKLRNKDIFGKTWTTDDAYNLILLNQVNALLSLGASKELKTVVLNLWTRYLKKTNVTSASKKKTRLSPSLYPRLRDIEVIIGGCSELIPKPRLKKNAYDKKKQKADSSVAKKWIEREPEASELDEHYFSESDTMTDYGYLSESSMGMSDVDASDGSDSEASVKICRVISRSEKEMKHMNRWALGRSIQRMNLSLTLAFLYLGLLLLREQIVLSDILCWVWEDRIPLYNTADVFPEDMKFQLFDTQTFRLQHAITHERVRSDTGHLAKFLGISKIDWNPLEYIAARFIKELSLPHEMFGMVSNLISAYPSNIIWESNRRWNVCIPNYEGKAVAYIIIALKLLFGLNGKSEWIISKYSKELTKKQDSGDILFDFHEWRKHTSIKFWLSSLSWRRNIRAKFIKQTTDLDEMVNFYKESGRKWKGKFCIDHSQKQKSQANVQILYDALCEVFSMLTVSTPVEKSGDTASSFSLRSEAEDVFSKLSKASRPNFGHPEIYNLRTSDFSQKTLDYLLDSPLHSEKSREISKKVKKRFKRIRKPYSKWLEAYKKYELVNSSVRAMPKSGFHPKKTRFPMMSSILWLVSLLASVLDMKQRTIFQEITLLENSVMKLKRKSRRKKTCKL